jgi:hypothetical protein
MRVLFVLAATLACACFAGAPAPAAAQTCGPGCVAYTFSVEVILGTDTLTAGGRVVSTSHDLFISNLMDSTLSSMIATNTVGAGGLFLASPPEFVRHNITGFPTVSTSQFFATATPDALLTTTGSVDQGITEGNFPLASVADLPPAMVPDLLGVNPGASVRSVALGPESFNAYEYVGLEYGNPVDALIAVEFHRVDVLQRLGPVPEPAGWTTMLLGFGGLGGLLRLRRRPLAT